MKTWLFLLPLIFLAGLVAGGFQPRAEARRLRQELENHKKAARAAPPQERQLAGFLNMLPMDTGRREDSAPPSATNEAPAPTGTQTVMAAAGPVADPAATNAPTPRTPEERIANFQARLDQAAEAWKLRAEIARGAFASKTGFTEREMADFDVLVVGMNIRMQDLFEQTAKQVEEGSEFTSESGIRLMSGITQAMVLTYDEMDRKLPATWRNDAGTGFDLITYVDPNVARPLVGVADKLPARTGENRGRRFGGGGPFGRP